MARGTSQSVPSGGRRALGVGRQALDIGLTQERRRENARKSVVLGGTVSDFGAGFGVYVRGNVAWCGVLCVPFADRREAGNTCGRGARCKFPANLFRILSVLSELNGRVLPN